ncbi:D-alanyl-D-alanine carboxypeptidase/D-alanyl-D-alanine-endopeptidase [Anabaena cylindrica FACHB-243]|uniref:D-alanyl-D-alanine carboxypeptidase/D-alanyl-D-alanine endopeptidase n=1 Tax=Anabaena sp. PCC 7938 TaxID=1296340 RepID=UPI0005AB1C69|nr:MULTISPECIES: D-alanyl-D-alanine carboxypeptidase/D-alanyl-D-alanine-endopeptidase [Anabaena]MBD2417005.1 D-alanyl-D-alanine carboxypeptidase/D-alanyl-D-alanine-endopeptidase [Anabaena cylindrica FACHB-243]MCM2406542.1 D-alanyl-D-alanine carboxypeptidase/D-alanyl-D-alanine-endopeptidase [Anabaena sp. CCAP 1446/1C]
MYKKISISLTLLFLGIQIGVNQQIAQSQTPTVSITNKKYTCPYQLQSYIDAVVNRSQFSRMRWGILVKPLVSTKTLYSLDANKYFIPASNTKLFTTAAALQKLGADFRIRTSIYQDHDGVLRVVGRGDPSLKNTQLTMLAKQLYQQGIREVNQLIADDSYFQGELVHPSWQWEDVQAYYGAPVNSLILNENASVLTLLPQNIGQPLKINWSEPIEGYWWQVENNSVTTQKDEPGYVEVTRDLKGQILRINGQLAVNSKPDITALAVFNPIDNFLRHFRQSLASEGIAVKQTSSSNNLSKNEQEIAAIESPPLSELLVETNVNSNNLYAESLLRTLANKQPLAKNQTTADLGLQVLKTTFTELGIAPTSYILVDGSGLSRKNLITPEALVELLQIMGKSPQSEVFRTSLPIASMSGTLKNRFLNTSAERIVQAKTGTMMGVVSLSGYINAPNYEPLVFSIMVNQSEQPASVVRKAMDEIVVLLSQLKRC